MKQKINKRKKIEFINEFDVDKLSKKEIENQIINYNDNYLKLKDTIENERQDLRLEKLKNIDPSNPLLMIISSDLNENLPKIKHDTKMLSLEKVTNDPEKLYKWIENKHVDKFVFQPKLDGHSLSIVYENGKHVLSKVRGNGEYGNDVTKNSRFVKGIINEIKDKRKIEIRGEVIIKTSDFKEIEGKYENARNGVSLVVPKSTQDVIDRKMSFIGYSIIVNGENIYDEVEKFKILKELGFETPYFKEYSKKELTSNLNKIKEIINEFDSYRGENSELDYLTDGIVLKINSYKEQIELGENNHDPNWAIAYKFLSEEKQTKLINIEWNVSRKGYLIPVGILEKIELSGTSVSRVTLNNASYIKDGDIRLGDDLIIRKSGEIIPFLVENLSSKKRQGEDVNHIHVPSTCPNCNSSLMNNGVHLKCSNINCSEKQKKQIEFFANSLGIENLGNGIINSLYENKILEKPEDIFKLTIESFKGLEGFGDILSKKIIKNIGKIKESVTPSKLIKSLGIDGLGERIAIKLLKKYGTIEKLLDNMSIGDFNKIEGIGDINSKTFYEGLIENKDLLIELSKNLGLLDKEMFKNISNKLEGKSFCITGTLSKGRKEIEELIESNGGKNKKDINKNTNYLVLGEGGGSKLTKAQKLLEKGGDIKIISEDEFLNLIK